MVLCEAAGFNHIFVETVGVGQSETMVSQLADCFLYLAMPGTGDELQGIKKGIMEMADLIAMNKSEGEYRTAAERGALEVKRALQLVTRNQEEWIPSVSLVSGLFCEGFEALEADFERYFRHAKIKGAFEQKRNQQNQFWFERSISEGIQSLFASDVNWISLKSELKKKVLSKEVSPFEASLDSTLALLVIQHPASGKFGFDPLPYDVGLTSNPSANGASKWTCFLKTFNSSCP